MLRLNALPISKIINPNSSIKSIRPLGHTSKRRVKISLNDLPHRDNPSFPPPFFLEHLPGPHKYVLPMNKYIVELIATFFLVLIIGLAAVLGLAGPFAPLAIGLGLVVLVYMGGHVSGAHYNPAVTLGIFIRGRCKGREVLPYILAELLGAVLAALVVKNIFAGHVQVDGKAAEITLWAAGATGPVIASESLFTFLLVFVILNVATAKGTANNQYYGLAIGFTVLVGVTTVGSVSPGAFNPAATVGLALMGKMAWADTWMHFLPQALGGVLAAFAFKGLYPEDK